jgi:Bardet-Biedl syndrome 1 protein
MHWCCCTLFICNPEQVWKGTQKASEVELQDVPVAVCALLLDSQGSRLPTVAVAAGSHIYMFQNLRPFYKFTLPAASGQTDEQAIW